MAAARLEVKGNVRIHYETGLPSRQRLLPGARVWLQSPPGSAPALYVRGGTSKHDDDAVTLVVPLDCAEPFVVDSHAGDGKLTVANRQRGLYALISDASPARCRLLAACVRGRREATAVEVAAVQRAESGPRPAAGQHNLLVAALLAGGGSKSRKPVCIGNLPLRAASTRSVFFAHCSAANAS